MQADTNNPFAPPRSRVEDVHAAGQTQPIKLWSARGRIGRLRLIAWTMLSYLAASIGGALVGVIAGVMGSSTLSTASMLLVYAVVWFSAAC